jgi:O-antigen/teichoic acid export membrane protein
MNGQATKPGVRQGESFAARLGDGVVEALIPLVPLLYLVRALSPAELGLLGLALAGTALLQHLIALRAESVVGGADGPDSATAARDRAVVTALGVCGLTALAVVCAVLAIALPAFALVFALAPALAAIRFVDSLELAGVMDEGRIARHRMITMLGNLIGLALTVGLISGLELGWPGRILALVLAEGGVVVIRAMMLARQGRGHGVAWEPSRARTLIGAAAPTLAAALLLFVLDHGNRLVALGTLTMADVGAFVVAYRVGSSVVVINRSLAFALAPRVKACLSPDRLGDLRRLHIIYALAILALGAAIAVTFLAAGPWILGPAFAPAAPIVAIVALGYGFQGIQRVGGIMRTRFGLAAPSPWHLATGAVVGLAVALVLAPTQGAPGVALGSTLGLATVAVLSAVSAHRALPRYVR